MRVSKEERFLSLLKSLLSHAEQVTNLPTTYLCDGPHVDKDESSRIFHAILLVASNKSSFFHVLLTLETSFTGIPSLDRVPATIAAL